MVSMKHIADACGVSVATVSKALNDRSDIGEDTKKEIRRIAKELGYLPNMSARVLRTKRTYSIGVLFADEAQSGLTHPYFSSILDNFKVYAESQGYDITFLNCSKTRENRMTLFEHSVYRGFDGVFIACINFNAPEVVELIQSKIPIVTMDYQVNDRTSVSSDNVKGMSDLVSYIIDQGHTRIAYIYGDESTVTRNRIAAFYQTLERNGIAVPDTYLKKSFYRNLESASRCTEELLSLDIPPTCIIYPDDYSAVGGINHIKKHGLSIPDDISVAGYDGVFIADQLEPKLTTVYQDTKTLGSSAAQRLIELIEKPKLSIIEHIVIDSKLIVGGSIRSLEESSIERFKNIG